ncbi:MAG: redox-sensing transcriptional repressor Rex [Halanaerobiales bacterium]
MKKIPQATIQRLVVYYRYLNIIANQDEEEVICSSKLGQDVGVSSAQVRKDLSYFGEFGCKGVGYNINDLKKCLAKILGLNQNWEVVLVGAGNLGRALVNFPGFRQMGINIVEVFDNDLDNIGNKIGEQVVNNVKDLEKTIINRGIKMAIMAIPREETQLIAARLVKMGIKAIWNFAPVPLKVPDDVVVYNEDLSSSIVTLLYLLKEGENKNSEKIG